MGAGRRLQGGPPSPGQPVRPGGRARRPDRSSLASRSRCPIRHRPCRLPRFPRSPSNSTAPTRFQSQGAPGRSVSRVSRGARARSESGCGARARAAGRAMLSAGGRARASRTCPQPRCHAHGLGRSGPARATKPCAAGPPSGVGVTHCDGQPRGCRNEATGEQGRPSLAAAQHVIGPSFEYLKLELKLDGAR